MPQLLALGICIGLVTGFIQSLGLTLQRKAQYVIGISQSCVLIGERD